MTTPRAGAAFPSGGQATANGVPTVGHSPSTAHQRRPARCLHEPVAVPSPTVHEGETS